MMDIDDDDDEFLFDEPDDDAPPPLPGLVVLMPVPNSDLLNTFEMRWRMSHKTPVAFVDVDEETGRETLANPETFAAAMGLPPGVLPSLEQADAWAATGKEMAWTW